MTRPWPYPHIVAHRGGGSLAPENTLAAIDVGARHGHKMIEFDAKLAQDGYLVRAIDATTVGVSFGEDTTDADVAALLSGFGAQPGAAGGE